MRIDKNAHEYVENTFAVMSSTDEEKDTLHAVIEAALVALDAIEGDKACGILDEETRNIMRTHGEENTLRALMLFQYIIRILPGLSQRLFVTGLPYDNHQIEEVGCDIRSTCIAYALAAIDDDSPVVKLFPDLPGKIADGYKKHCKELTGRH